MGTVTRPAEPALASPRGDLVGRTSSGLLSITREGSAAPEIEDAIFRIKSEDGNCVPAPDQVCRYVISVARIRLGPFTMDGQSIGGLRLRNLDQIRVSIGGSQGNVARIPDGTRFDVGIDLSGGETYIGVFSSFGADISINPAGEGLIALSASFAGRVFDRDTVIQGVVTADTPLRNRMPVADAGPDQSVSSNDCEALVTLDGGNSHDPDGNLSTFTWIWNQRIIAFGQNPTVPLDRSGQWVLQVRVEDSFGSLATDSMVVDVTLPAQCGAL